jgi:hypothetical protein
MASLWNRAKCCRLLTSKSGQWLCARRQAVEVGKVEASAREAASKFSSAGGACVPHDAATMMCILLCGAGQHATFHVTAGDVGVEGLVTRHGLHAQGVSIGITRCVSRAAGGIAGIEERSNAHHYTPSAAGVGGNLRKRSTHILWLVHAQTSHGHHTRTHIANITNQKHHKPTQEHTNKHHRRHNASRTMQSAKRRRTRMRPCAGTRGATGRRWQGRAGADDRVR